MARVRYTNLTINKMKRFCFFKIHESRPHVMSGFKLKNFKKNAEDKEAVDAQSGFKLKNFKKCGRQRGCRALA